jgi:hypothetical protein
MFNLPASTGPVRASQRQTRRWRNNEKAASLRLKEIAAPRRPVRHELDGVPEAVFPAD